MTIVASLLGSANTGAASAASLKDMGDGRIQFQAFGETVVFTKVEADDVIFVPAPRCGDNVLGGMRSFTWILAHPEFQACFEKDIPDQHMKGRDGILMIRAKREGDYVYPGHVKVDVFPKYGGPWIGLNSSVRDSPIIPAEAKPDSYGFTVHPTDYPAAQKYRLYVLPASRRLGAASHPLYILCAPVLGDETTQQCGITLRSSDKLASLGMSWRQDNFRGPDPSWLVYDQTARDMANAIFVARPKGDLQ